MTMLMRGGNKITTAGFAAGAGTGLTPNATANTKGSYSQIEAATTEQCSGLHVGVFPGTGVTYAGGDLLIDVAFGAASSEVDVVQNLPFTGYAQYAPATSWLWLPIEIPESTRISARCQSTATSGGDIELMICRQASHPLTPKGLGKWVTYGADTATSTAVTLTSNFGSPTAYSQVTASLPEHGSMLYVVAQGGGVPARTIGKFDIDVAVGTGGNEVDFLSVPITGSSQENVGPWVTGPFFVDIPAGTRLSVRAECHSGAGSDIDVALLIGH